MTAQKVLKTRLKHFLASKELQSANEFLADNWETAHYLKTDPVVGSVVSGIYEGGCLLFAWMGQCQMDVNIAL